MYVRYIFELTASVEGLELVDIHQIKPLKEHGELIEIVISQILDNYSTPTVLSLICARLQLEIIAL